MLRTARFGLTSALGCRSAIRVNESPSPGKCLGGHGRPAARPLGGGVKPLIVTGFWWERSFERFAEAICASCIGLHACADKAWGRLIEQFEISTANIYLAKGF